MHPTFVIKQTPGGLDVRIEYPALPDGGERPQVVVPAGAWQAAASTGAHTLVSCTVSPGFEFAGFELAPPGWAPGPR